MISPFDWQEAVANRGRFVEGRLEQGRPIAAVSLPAGILVLTQRRQARKVFEIYDRLVFSAIGQQSDVEALRMAAVDFAAQEGFRRSEQDVTIQRVVTALSTPMKAAFGNFGSAPFVAKGLLAQLEDNREADLFFSIDFDGDFVEHRQYAAVAGDEEVTTKLLEKLEQIWNGNTSVEEAVESLKPMWELSAEGESREPWVFEAAILDRSPNRENRFRAILP